MSIDEGGTSCPMLTLSYVTVEIRPSRGSTVLLPPPRRINRIPLNLRLKKPNQQYIYDPIIVSLGPYHHGEDHLSQLEKFKHEARGYILRDSAIDLSFYYDKIFERIDEIRNCYVEVTKEEYDDATLSEMILLDTFFYIYFMKLASVGDKEAFNHLIEHVGVWVYGLLFTDLQMLENQIPYWVIKLLIKLRFGEDEGKTLLCKYICDTGLVELDFPIRVPWEDGDEHGEKEEEPIHILEAGHRMLSLHPTTSIGESGRQSGRIFEWMMKLKKKTNTMGKIEKNKYDNSENLIVTHNLGRQFYSVTDLKTKGIHFGPSSRYWRDVRFKSNAFYGEIQIPISLIGPYTPVFLHNVIAYEMSQCSYRYYVTSYISFMKGLLVNSKDVKELREKGILSHSLGSDEEVVKIFHEIDTLPIHCDHFDEVKMRITAHCNNKGKTWIAEFINTKLKSPWTAIALLAATFLLVLTFLQTYYTIRVA